MEKGKLIKLYNDVGNRYDSKKFDDDYKQDTLILLDNFLDLEPRYRAFILIFTRVKGWHEVIPKLLNLTKKIIDNKINSHWINNIGGALQDIGFPQDKLQEYSDRIFELSKRVNNYEGFIPLFMALALSKDNNTHTLLKQFLKDHNNHYPGTIEAISNYLDPSDLSLLLPYTEGNHFEKGSFVSNAELRKYAKKAYNKIAKANNLPIL